MSTLFRRVAGIAGLATVAASTLTMTVLTASPAGAHDPAAGLRQFRSSVKNLTSDYTLFVSNDQFASNGVCRSLWGDDDEPVLESGEVGTFAADCLVDGDTAAEFNVAAYRDGDFIGDIWIACDSKSLDCSSFTHDIEIHAINPEGAALFLDYNAETRQFEVRNH